MGRGNSLCFHSSILNTYFTSKFGLLRLWFLKLKLLSEFYGLNNTKDLAIWSWSGIVFWCGKAGCGLFTPESNKFPTYGIRRQICSAPMSAIQNNSSCMKFELRDSKSN